MAKSKRSIVASAVLLAGSIAANGYFYQQLNLEKQTVTDITGQLEDGILEHHYHITKMYVKMILSI